MKLWLRGFTFPSGKKHGIIVSLRYSSHTTQPSVHARAIPILCTRSSLLNLNVTSRGDEDCRGRKMLRIIYSNSPIPI
eukprot:scaffold2586_cov256-Skeletonema_marinoi.AAC.8